jgi:hypothetical protein
MKKGKIMFSEEQRLLYQQLFSEGGCLLERMVVPEEGCRCREANC